MRLPIEVPGIDATFHEHVVGKNRHKAVCVGANSPNVGSAHRIGGYCERSLAVSARDDDLGEKRVVICRYNAAGANSAVDPNIARNVECSDHTGRRHPPATWIFCHKSKLYRVTAQRDCVLSHSEPGT